jgi:PIN domain nuclease of toxin-antitoxin system
MILDSSAVLAVIFGEPGSDRAVKYLNGGVVPAIIHAEILSKLIERGLSFDEARQEFDDLGTIFSPMTREHAEAAARLTPLGKLAGLSLADRICIGLALTLDDDVLTADKKWATVPHGAKVTLIR